MSAAALRKVGSTRCKSDREIVGAVAMISTVAADCNDCNCRIGSNRLAATTTGRPHLARCSSGSAQVVVMNEDETAPRSSRIVSAVGRWIASIAGSEGVWASMSSLDRQRRGLRCSPFSTGASVSSPSVGALESRPERA